MQHLRKPRPSLVVPSLVVPSLVVPSLVVEAMVPARQAPQIHAHDTGSLRSDLLSTCRSSAHQKARTS